MPSDDIAIRAVRNANRVHTTQAVLLLAKHYGFDAQDALRMVGIEMTVAEDTPKLKTRRKDPVPVVGTSSDDEPLVRDRARKPRLTTLAKPKQASSTGRATRKKKTLRT